MPEPGQRLNMDFPLSSTSDHPGHTGMHQSTDVSLSQLMEGFRELPNGFLVFSLSTEHNLYFNMNNIMQHYKELSCFSK